MAFLALEGCSQTAANDSDGALLATVVVDDCYQATGPFTLRVSGHEIAIAPVSLRDDSVGVCAWMSVPLPKAIVVELSGDIEHTFQLARQEGKALVISITSPVVLAFRKEDTLLYD